jgi:hypothetical protein
MRKSVHVGSSPKQCSTSDEVVSEFSEPFIMVFSSVSSTDYYYSVLQNLIKSFKVSESLLGENSSSEFSVLLKTLLLSLSERVSLVPV